MRNIPGKKVVPADVKHLPYPESIRIQLLGWLIVVFAGCVLPRDLAGQTPTASGLLAHWKFDDLPGSASAQENVNNLTAMLTPTGAAIESGGISGNALRITRSANGAAIVGDHLRFATSAFTISAWVKTTPNTFGVDLGVVSKHYLTETNGYWLGVNNSVIGGGTPQYGRAAFYTGPIGGMSASRHPVSTTTTVNNGQWHHLVATHDPNGMRQIYVNGTPAEATKTGDFVIPSDAPLIIGAYALRSGQNLHFDGLIDEVQIYGRVLSNAEVDFLHNNPGQSLPSTFAPSITGQPENALGQIGGTATFTVSADGTAPLAYEWRKDGAVISGATSATLCLSNLRSDQAGLYTVRISNGQGSVVSDAARLSLPQSNGLVAYWRFDESTNAMVATEAVNHLHANLTPSGAAFEAGGISGNALRITRSLNGAAVVGDHLRFATNAFTISAWVKTTPSTFGVDLGVVSKHYLTETNGYWLGVNNSVIGGGTPQYGRAAFYTGPIGGMSASRHPVSTTTTVNNGQWHHLVATHDPHGVRQIYVNGAPAEATKTGDFVIPSDAPLILGAYALRSGVNLHFDGLIDEVQIYGRVLSDAEVNFLHGNPGQGLPTSFPPSILEHPQNVYRLVGAAASFRVVAGGTEPLSYQWRKDGTPIAGANTAMLNLVGLEAADGGLYTVEVSNGQGSVMSDAARLSLPNAAGLVAYWDFDEVPGATVAQETVNGLNANLTPSGAAFESGGISGNALRVERAELGAAVVGDHLRFATNAFTISAWVKTTTDTLGVDLGVVSKHYLVETNGYWLGVNNSVIGGGTPQFGRAAFYTGPIGGMSASRHPVSTTTTVNNGQWHHLVATHDPYGMRQIYVNGIPAEATKTGDLVIPSDAPLIIGAYALRGGMNLHFDGLIDEVQIYGRVLNLLPHKK